jgi:putative N-acetyltransferase (TIGR04045 family)
VTGASSRSTPAPSHRLGEGAPGLAAIRCCLASSEAEREAHFELRRAVFVDEQGLFAGDDRDEHDDDPRTLHALGLIDGEACGAVRLYPLEPTGLEWKGDRLAVTAALRTNHLGAELVRFAVSTAGRLGGVRMIAHVQLANVRFFEHLGWRTAGAPGPFHGRPHQLMSIRLHRGA